MQFNAEDIDGGSLIVGWCWGNQTLTSNPSLFVYHFNATVPRDSIPLTGEGEFEAVGQHDVITGCSSRWSTHTSVLLHLIVDSGRVKECQSISSPIILSLEVRLGCVYLWNIRLDTRPHSATAAPSFQGPFPYLLPTLHFHSEKLLSVSFDSTAHSAASPTHGFTLHSQVARDKVVKHWRCVLVKRQTIM